MTRKHQGHFTCFQL